jgi:hypothetical protein
MNAERSKLLRSTQRKMLRMMLGSGRKPPAQVVNADALSESTTDDDGLHNAEDDNENDDDDFLAGESWVEWIKRTTHCAEACLRKARVADWIEEQRKRYFKFAGHTARRTDGRWSAEMLEWLPQNGSRLPWRPTRRWGDALESFFRNLGFEAGA